MDCPEYIQTEPCRALFTAWTGWRGDDLLPRRRAVRLEDIKTHLSHVVVVDVRSDDEAIFRLAGTEVVEHMGFDPAGMNYMDLAPPADRQRRKDRVRAQVQQPCGARFVVPHAYADGEITPTECLVLPVWADEPGGPVQLFSISDHLTELPRLWRPVDGPQPIVVSDEFRFVDIGAGIPEDIHASSAATG